MHELAIPMRHTDPDFAALVREMRETNPSQDMLDSVLVECIVHDTVVPDLLAKVDITVLCATNADVAAYNHQALTAKFSPNDLADITPLGTARHQPALADWFTDSRAHWLPQAAVGAEVMVLENIDLANDIANGARATMHAFKCRAGRLTTVVIRMQSTGCLRNITRNVIANYLFEGNSYSRPTFPLILAYAMTVHKCQGATLDHVLLDIADPFSPGLLYVALFRVRTRATLRILHRPLASQCSPVPRLRPPDPSRRHLVSTHGLASAVHPVPQGLDGGLGAS